MRSGSVRPDSCRGRAPMIVRSSSTPTSRSPPRPFARQTTASTRSRSGRRSWLSPLNSVVNVSPPAMAARTRSGSIVVSTPLTTSLLVPHRRFVRIVSDPRRPVAQQAGQAAGADPPAPLVAHHDLVGRDGAAEVDAAGDPGDRPLGGRAVVGGVHLDPDGDAPLAGRQQRAGRAERLGEHDRRAAVQQPVRLPVALDGHRRDQPLGVDLDEVDAHPLGELALRGLHGRQHLVRRRAAVRHHPAARRRAAVRRGPGLRHHPTLRRPAAGVPVGGPTYTRAVAASTSAPSTGAPEGPPPVRRRPPRQPAPDPAPTPTRAHDRLLLLDGHSLAYRAFFALPVGNFSTTTGQPTNAVYGFTAMLINVLRDERPTHIAVAWDLAAPTFRHEAYAAYKAGRQEAPAEFRGQVSLVKEVCEALAIPMVSAPGYEADDVIATLATRAEAEGMDVLIVTGDRDALQLVDDRVTVLMTRRGISEMTRFTPEEMRDRYGLTPQQYPDFAALRGDPSDNLSSVPGVGEKTAAKWIQQFGSLGDLVDRVDQVPGKAGDALREHLADVVRNRTLTELSRDVPLDVGPHDLHLGQWDREAVHQLFDTLQFRVLRERLYATLSAVEPEADRGFDVDARVLLPGEAAEWLAEHACGGVRVGLHARGTWGRGTGALTGLALAVEGGAGAWLDPTRLTVEDETALARWLADPGPPKAAHDVKGPLLALHAH